jgi:RNA polymerase sigma-70 factor (ECF subfamily)
LSSDGEITRQTFPSTGWTIVHKAGSRDGEALRCLLERYLPALKSRLVVTMGIREAEAEDLLQSFVSCKFLEENLAGQADRSRGRFRTFVLTILDRFVIDQRRQTAAMKRGGGAGPPVDVNEVDVSDPGAGCPADVFDIEWARQLLGETIHRMEAECRAAGRLDIWDVFQARLLKPILEGQSAVAYEQLAEQHGFRSSTQAANVLTTGKRMFHRILYAVVEEYADTPEEIEAEIDDLLSILSRVGAGS